MQQLTTTGTTRLDDDHWAVIDMDTGTVLGTNVVLVRIPDDEDRWDRIQSHDATAWEYGQRHGIPLYRLSE
jgi:hypothetical protein